MGTKASNKILLFAGTYEGRMLAEFCAENNVNVDIRVATDYGKEVIDHINEENVFSGRLDENEIIKLLEKNEYDIILDATHPYATVATKNIKNATLVTKSRYVRVRRDTANPLLYKDGDIVFCDCVKSAVKYLNEREGKIFLTTGSKELSEFSALNDVKNRLIVRALPFEYSLKNCEEIGVSVKNIMLMQGPFDEELNLALMKKYDAKYLVSKQTGPTGGFDAKIEAAKKLGMKIIIIEKPSDEGVSLEEAKDIISSRKGR